MLPKGNMFVNFLEYYQSGQGFADAYLYYRKVVLYWQHTKDKLIL